MQAETSDDRAYTALINRRSSIHDSREITIRLGMQNDVCLSGKRYLGIRDDGRKQQSMGVPTLTADEPADTKPYVTDPGFHGSVIVTVKGKTSGMPTGTGKLVELEIKNSLIIKILRNRVAYIDR